MDERKPEPVPGWKVKQDCVTGKYYYMLECDNRFKTWRKPEFMDVHKYVLSRKLFENTDLDIERLLEKNGNLTLNWGYFRQMYFDKYQVWKEQFRGNRNAKNKTIESYFPKGWKYQEKTQRWVDKGCSLNPTRKKEFLYKFPLRLPSSLEKIREKVKELNRTKIPIDNSPKDSKVKHEHPTSYVKFDYDQRFAGPYFPGCSEGVAPRVLRQRFRHTREIPIDRETVEQYRFEALNISITVPTSMPQVVTSLVTEMPQETKEIDYEDMRVTSSNPTDAENGKLSDMSHNSLFQETAPEELQKPQTDSGQPKEVQLQPDDSHRQQDAHGQGPFGVSQGELLMLSNSSGHQEVAPQHMTMPASSSDRSGRLSVHSTNFIQNKVAVSDELTSSGAHEVLHEESSAMQVDLTDGESMSTSKDTGLFSGIRMAENSHQLSSHIEESAGKVNTSESEYQNMDSAWRPVGWGKNGTHEALESGEVAEEPYACQYDDTVFENSHHFASDNVETGDAVDEGSRSKYLEDDYAWRPILRLGWGDDNETYENCFGKALGKNRCHNENCVLNHSFYEPIPGVTEDLSRFNVEQRVDKLEAFYMRKGWLAIDLVKIKHDKDEDDCDDIEWMTGCLKCPINGIVYYPWVSDKDAEEWQVLQIKKEEGTVYWFRNIHELMAAIANVAVGVIGTRRPSLVYQKPLQKKRKIVQINEASSSNMANVLNHFRFPLNSGMHFTNKGETVICRKECCGVGLEQKDITRRRKCQRDGKGNKKGKRRPPKNMVHVFPAYELQAVTKSATLEKVLDLKQHEKKHLQFTTVEFNGETLHACALYDTKSDWWFFPVNGKYHYDFYRTCGQYWYTSKEDSQRALEKVYLDYYSVSHRKPHFNFK